MDTSHDDSPVLQRGGDDFCGFRFALLNEEILLAKPKYIHGSCKNRPTNAIYHGNLNNQGKSSFSLIHFDLNDNSNIYPAAKETRKLVTF